MSQSLQRKSRDLRRILIEPGRYELIEPGKEAIFERVRAVVAIDDDGLMQVNASELAIGMCGLTGKLDGLIERYNDGFRFI